MSIVLDTRFNYPEKLEALVADDIIPSEKSCINKFSDLLKRARDLSAPVFLGMVDEAGKKVFSPADFESQRYTAAQTEQGPLGVEFFVYAPRDKYPPSIRARWFLENDSGEQIVWEEEVSAKNFDREHAAYDPDAPKKFVLLRSTIDSIDRRGSMAARLARSFVDKTLQLASEI